VKAKGNVMKKRVLGEKENRKEKEARGHQNKSDVKNEELFL